MIVEIMDGETTVHHPEPVLVLNWDLLVDVEHYTPGDYEALEDRVRGYEGLDRAVRTRLLDALRYQRQRCETRHASRA